VAEIVSEIVAIFPNKMVVVYQQIKIDLFKNTSEREDNCIW